MDETVINLGRVSVRGRGAYSAEETYDCLDIVRFSGAGWLCLKNGTTGVEPVDGETWMLLVERGAQGEQGPTGSQGPEGKVGPQGSTGPQGPRGYGIQSAKLNDDFTLTLTFEGGYSYTTTSIRGEVGPRGETGLTGPEGPQGEKGLTGDQGPVGPEGPQGKQGDVGPTGDKGDTGDVWVPKYSAETGDLSWEKNAEEVPEAVNIRGPQGDRGPTGETGAQGDRGPAGDVWVPRYDGDSGDLSWEKNAEGDPQPVNIKGPKGDPGPKGDRGPEGPAGPGSGDMVASTYDPNGKAEDIFAYADKVAGDKAGEAVKNVSAENVKFTDGQTFQQKLESGELKGDRGETGPAGPAGPQGADGEPGKNGEDGQPGKDGAPGAAGKDGATWRPSVDSESGELSWTQDSSGDAPESVNIKGPKGDKGEPGSNGSDGAAGAPGTPGRDGAAAGFGTPTAEVDDTSGTPSVEVTASGDDTQKVFHFAFKGLKGEKGEDGAPGAKGDAGAPGKDGAAGAKGDQGDTWVPTVSDEGVISWAKNSGEPSQNVNIKGPVGPAGPAGPAGAAGSNGKDGAAGAVGPKGDPGPKSDYIEVNLTTSGWSGGTSQTVSNSKLNTSGYNYIVGPAQTSRDAYGAADIQAEDISVEGQMTFKCKTTPKDEIKIRIYRIAANEEE